MACVYFLILTVFFNTALTRITQDQPDKVIIPCENDAICKENLPGSKCVDGECLCQSAEDCEQKEISVAVTKVGQRCRTSEDCLIDNSDCMEEKGIRTCGCMGKYVASKDGKNCLQLVDELNFPCLEDAQCVRTEHAICQSGFCRCVEGMQAHLGSCYYIKALGDSCQQERDCKAIENAVCFERKCACKQGFVKGRAGCLLAATTTGTNCLEDVQCKWYLGDGAVCYQTKCHCLAPYIFNWEINKCVRHINLSHNCTSNTDCYEIVDDRKYVECSHNTCRCKPAFIEFEFDCLIATGAASTNRFFFVTTLSVSFSLYVCLF